MISITSYFDLPNDITPALVHRSYCNEHPGLESNERLEFLGDAILALIISERLYVLFPKSSEGDLTHRRSVLVQTTTLAEKAKVLGLNELLLLSKGENDLGGRQNPGLLADTFEAVLGQLYLKKGLASAKDYLIAVFPDEEIIAIKETKDPKSQLQELIQADGSSYPVYKLVSTSGPDHSKIFTVAVSINGDEVAQGVGTNIQKAETEAAKSALGKLQHKMLK